MFVDADDYVTETYISGLYNKFCEHGNADIAIGGLIHDCDGPCRDSWMKEDKEVSLEEVKKDFDFYYDLSLLGMTVSKIFKKQLLGEDRFDTSLSIGEDFIFNLKYFLKCRILFFADTVDYVYCIRNTASAMNSYNKKRFICEKRAYRAVKMFKYGELKYTDDAIDRYFCGAGRRQVLDICLQDYSWAAKKKEISAILEDELFRQVIHGPCGNPRFNAKVLHALCRCKNYALIRFAMFARSIIRRPNKGKNVAMRKGESS